MTHVLVVSEPEEGVREYEIEHDPSCPFEEEFFGNDFEQKHEPMTYRVYTCGVGQQENWTGIQDALDGIEELAPGRYPIRSVVEHTPSLPTNGGEEWDAWIEIVSEEAK